MTFKGTGADQFSPDTTYCTGSVLSERLILSAAHCTVLKNKILQSIEVFMGPSYKQKTFSSSARAISYPSETYGAQEKYSAINREKDLVILRLNKSLPIDSVPIRLHVGTPHGVHVIGYGTTQFSDWTMSYPDWGVLRGNELQISTDSKPNLNWFFERPIKSLGEKGEDILSRKAGICNGDSGAPVFDFMTGEVFGVVQKVSADLTDKQVDQKVKLGTNEFLSANKAVDLCNGRGLALDIRPYWPWIQELRALESEADSITN